jgi:hypothetical protein
MLTGCEVEVETDSKNVIEDLLSLALQDDLWWVRYA